MDDESFGRRLRRERERRQIALSSISANTKISVALLEGLERDDLSRWPSGIFRRAFIRSYAGAVGLPADAVLKEFLERFPDPADADAAKGAVHTPPLAGGPADDLRLLLAEARGVQRWAAIRDRWAGVAWDVGVIVAFAVTLFIAIGAFWMPLGVSSLMYFVGGAFVFGTTPGIFLFSHLSAPPSSRSWFGRRRPSKASVAVDPPAAAPDVARTAGGTTRIAVRLVRGRATSAARETARGLSDTADAPFELHAVAPTTDRRASR